MPKPKDLRDKVIEYHKIREKYCDAGLIFKISVSAIGRWTGDIKQ